MPSGTDSNVVEEACYPTNSTGGRDPNAPCAQVAALVNICAYGNSSSTDLNVPESNPADQQKCFCGGPFWQYLDGCMECARLHGAPLNASNPDWTPVQSLSAISSSYCGAATATQALDDFLTNWTATATSIIDIGTITGGVDVLGTSTDVSLYFTLTSTGATTVTTSGGATGTGAAGVAATNTGKDAASGLVTGSATGSVTAVSTSGSKSAATGLQVSGAWAAILLAAALTL
ncbi:MAG: hypothetical protein LQ347_005377 [Umbilicaria vellea]|nr:MAG: hypothetical protein LQ347_005377 [Umbilicaria vellea]